MVVITVKELKEPFTVLRPEEFLDNNRFPCGNILILLQKKNQDHMDTFSNAWSRTVPEYIDRSDDVAWMLGCSLILLTIQVSPSPQKGQGKCQKSQYQIFKPKHVN